MRKSFGPMDHSSLVKASEAASDVPVTRELGAGFASARTAVNVTTTVQSELASGPTRMVLRAMSWRIALMRKSLRSLSSQRAQVTSWLSDPNIVEQGREQRLERLLRSTENAQGENLHPRYGLIRAVGPGMRILLALLYLFQFAFDWPFYFLQFGQGFGAPEGRPLSELISNPAVIASASLASLISILIILTAEFGGKFVANVVASPSRNHTRKHAWFAVATVLLLVAGLSVLMFVLARSRFQVTSAFQGGTEGLVVGEYLIGALPIILLVMSVLAHLPRVVEAGQRARFAKVLDRRHKRAVKLQAKLARTYETALAATTTTLHRLQAKLDTIGAVADQQVTWTALESGVYGGRVPQWRQAVALGALPGGTPVTPTIGLPTTQIARVANYVPPQLLNLLRELDAVRREAASVRRIDGVFDAFRADPAQFLLAPALSPAEPGNHHGAVPVRDKDEILAAIRAMGEPLFATLEATPTVTESLVAPSVAEPAQTEPERLQEAEEAPINRPTTDSIPVFNWELQPLNGIDVS